MAGEFRQKLHCGDVVNMPHTCCDVSIYTLHHFNQTRQQPHTTMWYANNESERIYFKVHYDLTYMQIETYGMRKIRISCLGE